MTDATTEGPAPRTHGPGYFEDIIRTVARNAVDMIGQDETARILQNVLAAIEAGDTHDPERDMRVLLDEMAPADE